MLKNVRDAETGPILVHVVHRRRARATRRPKPSADKYHGVAKFDVVTGAQAKAKPNAPSYTKVFGESLIKEAAKDDAHRRHHRRDAVRHRARPVRQGVSRTAPSTSASPSSMP